MKKLLESIKLRVGAEITGQSSLSYLRDSPVDSYINTLVSTVYLYTRPKKGSQKTQILFSEVIAAVGHSIRGKLKQPRDSSNSAKTGAFLLYSFQESGILNVALGGGPSGHATYLVYMLDDERLTKMWGTLPINQIEKLPVTSPYAPWTTSRHPTGMALIKTGNREVLHKVTPETHPIIFDVVNRAQKVGRRIDHDLYKIHLWAVKSKTDAFAEIWELQNPEAKATKLREVKAIGGIAKKLLNDTFYHLYYYDFRGRKYPTTAYLHEQGSDLARGLLRRADYKPMTEKGFWWLMVVIASTWAGDAGRPDGLKTDKIPLQDRYEWSMANEEALFGYAESPKENQRWMKADKPWQFLSACFELKRLREWQFRNGADFQNFNFPTNLEGFLDGSNNGCQHLAALTRDEETAPHVNLVPLALPGDLYKYVGEHVWSNIEAYVRDMDQEEVKDCTMLVKRLSEMKRIISSLPQGSEERKTAVTEIQAFKKENEAVLSLSAPVFWDAIKDSKARRKVVKRNVMTLPYGGTAFGLGEQQISDAKKHGIDALMTMEHRWGAYMGRAVFEDCKISLRRPMQLLSVFENAGKQAEARGEFLSWTVPITNFPVVQNYTTGVVKKIWVQYGPPNGMRLNTGYFENTYQISICFLEDVVPAKGKQSQAASPNAIHSLDAAHLAMTVHACPFDVTTIHDSFGALLPDLPVLYTVVREKFVELYRSNPLESLMKDIGGDLSTVEIGTLDLEQVTKSEYCFS